MNETQKISAAEINRQLAQAVLNDVYIALNEKGYNPITQIAGYIMSGDPSYITNHKNARAMVVKIERDELLEELLRVYADGQGLNK